jgi:hypothetical protein
LPVPHTPENHRRRSPSTWPRLAAVACLASQGCSSGGGGPAANASAASVHDAGEPLPVVTGPITGGIMGKPYTATPVDLASAGYVEEEYFFEGTTTAYDGVGTQSADGMWSVRETSKAHYKTRMLVRRPTDAARFNGTVVVEWLNVTGGVDADPDFAFQHGELLRSGFAYVGVSAQAQGVVGGGAALVAGAVPLVQWDPQRYGSLSHPGDDYSYDIYTQAALVLRHPRGVDPLGGLVLARLLGDGESQSAFRMVTYVDAIQPLHHAFDAFLIHSRAGGGAPLVTPANSGLGALLLGPSLAHIRADLGVPVLQFETESDVLGLVSGLTPFSSAREPDTAKLRTWEVAGTAHADLYLLTQEGPMAGFGEPGDGGLPLGCTEINAGPQHWVETTALHALEAWMTGGPPPPNGAPLMLADGGASFELDSYGNARGGIRTAAVDVPIAAYSGKGDPSNVLCALFGKTTPFSPTQLASLYPTHDDYVKEVAAATMKAQQAGFILSADAPSIVQEAQDAPIPSP